MVLALLCGAAAAAADVPALHPPVPGRVAERFSEDGRFGPGHRGLDLVVAPGAPVGAPVAGRVHFAGTVAGRRWVTVAASARVLVTVGPLAGVAVARGDHVVPGTVVGTAAGDHGAGTLHLSLRVDTVHVDPAPHLLGGTGPWRATLLPAGARRPDDRSVPAVPGNVR